MRLPALAPLVAILHIATARNVPQNVRSFYNSLKTCSNKLAGGFWSSDSGQNSIMTPLPRYFPFEVE